MDTFNLSFFNLNNSSKELDKIKKIKAGTIRSDNDDEKKPKRKFAKKPKLTEDSSFSVKKTENIFIEENDIADVNVQ